MSIMMMMYELSFYLGIKGKVAVLCQETRSGCKAPSFFLGKSDYNFIQYKIRSFVIEIHD